MAFVMLFRLTSPSLVPALVQCSLAIIPLVLQCPFRIPYIVIARPRPVLAPRSESSIRLLVGVTRRECDARKVLCYLHDDVLRAVLGAGTKRRWAKPMSPAGEVSYAGG